MLMETISPRRDTRGGGVVQVILVLVVILVVTVIALKMYQRSGPPVVPGGGHPARAVLDRVELRIEGMTSDADALQVTEAVRRLSGVASVHTDFSTGRAHIAYDPNRVQPEQFIAAIERAGFRARR